MLYLRERTSRYGYCLIPALSLHRVGKGVFSAMKLGKTRPPKDDGRKQGNGTPCGQTIPIPIVMYCRASTRTFWCDLYLFFSSMEMAQTCFFPVLPSHCPLQVPENGAPFKNMATFCEFTQQNSSKTNNIWIKKGKALGRVQQKNQRVQPTFTTTHWGRSISIVAAVSDGDFH